MHTLQKYWSVAFKEFSVGPQHFFSPEMPDPILSPRFLTAAPDNESSSMDYFNLIQESYKPAPELENYNKRNDFYLCEMNIKEPEIDFLYRVEPMQEASEKLRHKAMLQDGFPKDYDFLLQLEKFLPRLNANYSVATIFNKEGLPVASVSLGMAGEWAVILSGMVHSYFRGQKLSRQLQATVHKVCHDHLSLIHI